MVVLHRLVTGLAVLVIGTSASAQSYIGASPSGPRDNRVQVGVIVPFGNAGSAAERAPRIEIWNDQRSPGERAGLRLRLDADAPAVRPLRLGITLQQHPQMTLNGREMALQDGRKGISTLGLVGIGLGVGVIVLAVAATASTNVPAY